MEDDEVWKNVIAESNKERVRQNLQRNYNSREWPQKDSKDSAVLVPLVSVDDEPSVLFTVRSAQLSRHRNQVR